MTQDKNTTRGWITSNGVFVPCGFNKHNQTAAAIMEKGLEKSHVVAMIRLFPDMQYGMLAVTDGSRATRKQREKLFDLCTLNGFVFEDVACLIEDLFEKAR